MRYLNKICFINSAAVKYAELELDGNVHFIGTQGVGKSTLLRAILFFYNANSLKLGVPSGPTNKSFSEWYFPYQNSLIIYEVQRETGAYSILAFKVQNRVCFYFIDAPYDRTFFIDAAGKALESWDKIRMRLDAGKVFYSRRIKSFEEYRDILYGNDQGKKEFRRYALLESRQYLNIPRTIQNIFLNSKLDAEFIKQTIIDSISEDELHIDLQNYAHHLKDFEAQLNDIRQFRQPAVQKQGDKISQHHIAINHLQREAKQYARNLQGALQAVTEKEPHLNEALAAARQLKTILVETNVKENSAYQRRRDKIAAGISVLDDKLKTAKSKEQHYKNLNIGELVKRTGERKNLEQSRRNLQAEEQLMNGQFQEIAQKYAALLTELENQEQNFLNLTGQEKLGLEKDFLDGREKLVLQYGQLAEELRKQHKAEMDGARQKVEEHTRLRYQLNNQLSGIKHTVYYAVEIEQQKDELKRLEHELLKAKNRKEGNVSRLEVLKREAELEEKSLTDLQQRNNEYLQQRIESQQRQIEVISLKLERSRNSLYGWLNQHHPGWEKDIGKVCAEELLFDESLAPRRGDGAGSNFYGIQLDLSEHKKQVKSLDDYRHEQALLQQTMAAEQEKLQLLNRAFEVDLQNLKQRLHPKSRVLKENNRQLDYLMGQSPQQRDAAQLLLSELTRQAETEKRAALEKLQHAQDEVSEKELMAQQLLEKLEGQLNRQLKTKERERGRKVVEREQLRDRQLDSLDRRIEVQCLEYQRRKNDVLEWKNRELEARGVDTNRLQLLEKELLRIGIELEFIEQNRDLVAEYRKDKRELFERLQEFKNSKQLLEREQQQKKLDYEQQLLVRQQKLAGVNGEIDQLIRELEEIVLDQKEFERFKLSEIYQTFEADLRADTEVVESGKGCRTVIDELKENYYTMMQRKNDLKEVVDKFLGHFSVDNVFKFKTSLLSLRSYLDFSQDLTDFIEEDKIGEFETRINERFADIVTGIGKETTGLLSRTGEIQKVISKINRDFTTRNFVGAIRKIELKLDESANSVFVILQQIKEFNDQHTLDFGTRDLFSGQNHELNNKKAVELLTLLTREIGYSKSTTISLPDSFELKFRVEENQNDTGWVEKLANVGSDGTDVLVKAMVNIMLLNVFKEGVSKRFKNFRLHCMMDEIGKLHPSNVSGILKFANDRNIMLVNGSPTENNALNYKHIFKISKDTQGVTRVTRILTNHSLP